MTAAVAAHHLCQADNAATCSVSYFVTSLAAQLGQAPALALGYGNALCSAPGLLDLLSPASCARDPGLALNKVIQTIRTKLSSK